MTFPWIVGAGLLGLAGAGCLAIVVAVRAAWRRRRLTLWLIAGSLVLAGGAQLAQLNAGVGPVLAGGISVVTLLAATVTFLLLAFVITGSSGAARGVPSAPAPPSEPTHEWLG
ncbi:MAG TPA: hypothetical protein VMW47_02245 [Verrucomicrobiae bacterium]|nr:hypothetical protein [Verrucomicrobiae bacterium]